MRVTELQCANLIAAIAPLIYILLFYYCYCYYYYHYNNGEYLHMAIIVILLNIFVVAHNVTIRKNIVQCNIKESW